MKPEIVTILINFLVKRSDEAFARAEVMRLLLEKHEVFSQTEFHELFVQVVEQRKQQTAQLRAQIESNVSSEELRRFLERYEGTMQ